MTGELSIAPLVKGLEKLTSIRLAEVLTQKGLVPTEAITDALYAQDKQSEPFAQVIVSGGHITEWDLAKVVVENFHLPFIMASSYEVNEEVRDRLPKEVVFKHLIVPLDIFENVLVVAMPILTSFEIMSKIQRQHDCELFPYVGLPSENRKVLGEVFDDFNDWWKAEVARREKDAVDFAKKKRKRDSGDWMDIFDMGDEAIRQDLKKE